MPLIESLESRRLLAAIAPDPTFGQAGLTYAPLGVTAHLMKQNDGTLMLLGKQGGVWQLRRFGTNGLPDTTYAAYAGAAYLGSTEGRSLLAAVAAGDRVVVAAQEGNQVQLFRLNADGSADRRFAGGMRSQYIVPPEETLLRLIDVQVDSQGRILVATESLHDGQSTLQVNRFDAQGNIDTTFGAQGSATLEGGRGLKSRRWAQLAIGADGRFVAARYSQSASVAVLHAIDADGEVDPAYGTNGQAVLTLQPIANTAVAAMAFDPAGRLVIASYANTVFDAPFRLAVHRLLATGAPDASFGDAGRVDLTSRRGLHHNGPEKDWINDMAIDPETGRIVVATESAYMRLNVDGSLDTSFDDDGIADAVSDAETFPHGQAGEYYQRREPITGRDIVLNADGLIEALGYDRNRVNHRDVPVLVRFDQRRPIVRGNNHDIFINGTAQADTIDVRVQGPSVVIDLNGQITSFRATSVRRVEIDLRTDYTRYGGKPLTELVDTVTTSGITTTVLSGHDKADLTLERADAVIAHGCDTITSGDNDDRIYTYAGSGGIVRSGGGDDYVYAVEAAGMNIETGAGNDAVEVYGTLNVPIPSTINAGEGNDTVVAGERNQWLHEVQVYLGDGNDTLSGFGDRSTVFGGAGNDTIGNFGSYGRYDAEAGDDVFRFPSPDGVRNTLRGGEGDDEALIGTPRTTLIDIENVTQA